MAGKSKFKTKKAYHRALKKSKRKYDDSRQGRLA